MKVETFKFVDEILDEVKDDDELMRKFVFEFLTMLAVREKDEKFFEYAERWKAVSSSPIGIKSLDLVKDLLKEIGDD